MDLLKDPITVSAHVNADLHHVWSCWNDPVHIAKWYHASDDWGVGKVTNDLRVGGDFSIEMKALNGSSGFTFPGTYTELIPLERIGYTIDDGRKVVITFASANGGTDVTESFEAESENTRELQLSGWQAIMDNFKKYAETVR